MRLLSKQLSVPRYVADANDLVEPSAVKMKLSPRTAAALGYEVLFKFNMEKDSIRK